MRNAVVEGSENFDHLGFCNVQLNISKRGYRISPTSQYGRHGHDRNQILRVAFSFTRLLRGARRLTVSLNIYHVGVIGYQSRF